MTKLEEVARALFGTYQGGLPMPERFAHLTWEKCPDQHKTYLALARSAVEAMRVTTKAMEDAGALAGPMGEYQALPISKIYCAMIDAILNEKPHG